MNFDFSTLVTDRTLADVSRVAEITKKIIENTATKEELAEWHSTSMKGAYNYTDLNRVKAAMDCLYDCLTDYGYALHGYAELPVWDELDSPDTLRLSVYLENVHIIRSALALLPNTPEVPEDMVELSHTKANAIELILANVETIINAMCSIAPHAGQPLLYCGFGIYMKQQGDEEYIAVYTADGELLVTADMEIVAVKE